jgi:hypothetical protein
MIDASDASGSTDESNGAAAPSMGAILLAGGRGTRLDGVDKPPDDRRRLPPEPHDRCGRSDGGVRPITIVGRTARARSLPRTPAPLQLVREDPPYGGPVAAVIAALEAWRETCPNCRIGRSCSPVTSWTRHPPWRACTTRWRH